SLIPPVLKSVTVRRAQADAFRLYTESYGQWWPFATHSIGQDKVETAIMEPRKGGRLYERWKDGSIHPYREVLVWEPPHRVVHTWHVARTPEQASEVKLRFIAVAPGQTRVELEHRNWEKMGGDEIRDMRERYNNGWETVFVKGFGNFAGLVEG